MYKRPHRIEAIGANDILTILTDQEKTLVKCRHRIIVALKQLLPQNHLQNNVRVMLNLYLTLYNQLDAYKDNSP